MITLLILAVVLILALVAAALWYVRRVMASLEWGPAEDWWL